MPGLETGHISTTRENEIVCMLEKDFSGERRICPKCFSLHQVADLGDGFDPGTSNSSATLNWLRTIRDPDVPEQSTCALGLSSCCRITLWLNISNDRSPARETLVIIFHGNIKLDRSREIPRVRWKRIYFKLENSLSTWRTLLLEVFIRWASRSMCGSIFWWFHCNGKSTLPRTWLTGTVVLRTESFGRGTAGRCVSVGN